MKALIIGGTGTISLSVTKLLMEKKWDLTLLNRGKKLISDQICNKMTGCVRILEADMNSPLDVDYRIKPLLEKEEFDTIVNFINFTPEQCLRDVDLFLGKCNQYIFISSASAYQKPPSHYIVTESTPLANPFWEYSRQKIACEDVLMQAYREKNFPVTIVRPSHTYAEGTIPFPYRGEKGIWTEIRRLQEGKPLIIPGDGSSLWTVTHSKDFAKGFVGLMGNPHSLGEAVHITSDEVLTWNQIVETIANALGVKPEIKYLPSSVLISLKPDLEGTLLGDKSNSVVFDNSKIKRLVPEFVATIRFDQGVRMSLEKLWTDPSKQIFDQAWDEWLDEICTRI